MLEFKCAVCDKVLNNRYNERKFPFTYDEYYACNTTKNSMQHEYAAWSSYEDNIFGDSLTFGKYKITRWISTYGNSCCKITVSGEDDHFTMLLPVIIDIYKLAKLPENEVLNNFKRILLLS